MTKKAFMSLLVFFVMFLSQSSFGQTTESDSTYKKIPPIEKIHSPKKAGWMSTALPGLGQVYNKKYWKVPIVYAALGTVAYLWVDNNKQYKSYLEGYKSRIDTDTLNDNLFPGYTTEDLRELKNYYWRYRDLNAFIFAGVWALNILDAIVDAHLYTFDISENLSMKVQPSIYSPMGFGKSPTYGLSFCINF